MTNEYFTENAKRKRFLRLAQLRANIVLERLRILGHCANKSAYSFSEQDVNKIFNEIEDQLNDIKSKFKTRIKRKIVLE